MSASDFELDATIFGDADLVQRLDGYKSALRVRLVQAVRGAAERTRQELQGVELAGAVLKTRTGKLRGSVFLGMREQAARVSAVVYPKAKYGWMLGYGSPKNEVTVKAHARYQEGAGNLAVVNQETRRYFRRSKAKIHFRRVTYHESSIMVKAHTRRILKAGVAKPFMGPAFARIQPFLKARIEEAMSQARQDVALEAGGSDTRGTS